MTAKRLMCESAGNSKLFLMCIYDSLYSQETTINMKKN